MAARRTSSAARTGSARAGDVLSRRALNRALLERQLLLRRRTLPVSKVIEHLVGMQAQVPSNPYVALWTRLDRFRPEGLSRLIADRQAVRAPLMRATIHLATVRDCLALRPVMQPVLERAFATGSPFGRKLKGINKEDLLAAGRELVEERPRTRAELRTLLGTRWPDYDADSLAMAITYLVPLVQVTPRGLWGASGQPAWTTTDVWLGQPLAPDSSPDETIMRYFAAFGPATVQDVQAWCGLTKLREATERLRPRLRVFCDEDGRELLDVPGAPLPDPETPAPIRFLPEYDNVFLGHADRSRIVERATAAGQRSPLFSERVGTGVAGGPGGAIGTILIDGFINGTWKLTRQRDAATLLIEPTVKLSAKDRVAASDEGEQLVKFFAADAATHDVQVTRPT